MPRTDKNFSSPTEEEQKESDQLALIEDAAASAAGSQELEPLQESAALNKLLLRNARQSNNVISQKTGIPVGEVAERLTALLDNPGWRDDLMEEKLALKEVSMLLDEIRERMSRKNVDDEAWAQMARMQLQTLRTILEQLDKRRKAVDGQLALVTRLQAEVFGAAIRLAQERAVLNIQRRYPELDPEVIYAEFEDALPGAIDYVEAHIDEG